MLFVLTKSQIEAIVRPTGPERFDRLIRLYKEFQKSIEDLKPYVRSQHAALANQMPDKVGEHFKKLGRQISDEHTHLIPTCPREINQELSSKISYASPLHLVYSHADKKGEKLEYFFFEPDRKRMIDRIDDMLEFLDACKRWQV